MDFNARGDGRRGESANVETEPPLSPFVDLQRPGWEVCGVCTTALNSGAAPKLLPCLHAVCKSCVSKNNDDGNAKECPVCGQPFNLSEVTDCFIFEDSAPKCGGCEESALSGWCVQCEEALCSDCVLAHQRVKVTRNHIVIPREPPSGFTASLRCASHRQERLKFFCLTCDDLTCKDCQLINHRGHSFVFLEEALKSQKEQLQRLLHSIREHRISVKTSLLDLDERLHGIKESKTTSKKKLVKLVHSMHLMMLLRGRQLFSEVEELFKEEEKSLMEMKKSFIGLENRQEYITTFIQKILTTGGQCILLHKKQILKRAESLLSQKTCLSETILQPCLHLNEDLFQICRNFGMVKVARVPFTSTKKNTANRESNDAPKEEDCALGLSFKSVPTPQTLASSKTAPDQSQHVYSNRVQSKVPTVSHAGASSVSPDCTLVQAPQSLTTLVVPAQESHAMLQSAASHSATLQPSKRVIRSQSHPCPRPSTSHIQSKTLLPGQSVLKKFVLLPKPSSAKSQLLPPQYDNIPTAGPHRSFTSSMAHHSASLNVASSQSFNFSDIVPTQSPSLTLHHLGSRSVPSASTLAPSAQLGQGASNPKPNTSSGHTQQGFPLSPSISVQPAPPQPLQLNWTPQAVPAGGSLPLFEAPFTAASQNIILQHSQPTLIQSSPLLCTLLQNGDPMHNFTSFPIVNQTHVLTPPTFLLTAPTSMPVVAVAGTCNAPNITVASTLGGSEKSQHPMLNEVSCPPLPIVPNNSNKEHVNAVSSKPPLTGAQTPLTSSSPNQSKCAQKSKCELPVQAPADSVCDRDMSVLDRASPPVEEPDDNLPTSTVSEAESQELSSVQEQFLRLSPSPDLMTSVSVSGRPPSKSQLCSTLTMSLTESPVTSKHWSIGMPTSLRQLLEPANAPATNEASPTPDSEHASLLDVMQDDNEETDDSDSEPVEGKKAAIIFERDIKLSEISKKLLSVSLLRLPISVPTSGSPLPQYHIVSYNHTNEILLQEIQDDQPMQRWLRIPAQPDAASLSQSSHSLQLNNLLDCAVCLSAGATLICAECGRSFHTECHVPSVIFRPIKVWVCSLCQDVFDDTDPFSQDRLQEPYLSLQDQRRCEQLLLTLMCEEHSYLLYNMSKHTAGCVDFYFIRGRLLGKRSPPYRSAAELVSDLWALFDVLSTNSMKRDLVVKLQASFQEQLDVSFGKSLHSSLLRPTSREEQKGAPETVLEKDKASSSLKRMRENLSANSAPFTKKPRAESASEDSQVNQD